MEPKLTLIGECLGHSAAIKVIKTTKDFRFQLIFLVILKNYTDSVFNYFLYL